MTPLEQLKAARELISVPERWTKGALARDSDGNSLDPLLPEAVCFCAIGALDRVTKGGYNEEVWTAVRYAATGDRLGSVSEYNDGHEHSEVLKAFDKAIASLEAQQ